MVHPGSRLLVCGGLLRRRFHCGAVEVVGAGLRRVRQREKLGDRRALRQGKGHNQNGCEQVVQVVSCLSSRNAKKEQRTLTYVNYCCYRKYSNGKVNISLASSQTELDNIY